LVTEDQSDDASVQPENSGDSSALRAVHHGEALVAALLDTQKVVEDGPVNREPSVTDTPDAVRPVSNPPLTASTVISHTDALAFTPKSADAVIHEVERNDDQPNATDDAQSQSIPSEGGTNQTEPGNTEVDSPSGDEVDEDEASLARNLLEWVVVLAAAVAVAIILRTFVFQAFFIPSESMETTLYENDRILVNKVSYRLHEVNRGDVVVFRRPDDQPGEIRDLIKRVIGLPGESVEGRNSSIYINDRLLVEPYLDGDRFGDFGPVTVPEGELFMMGDNRDQSLDSRRFGTIDDDRIIGRAFFLFWPIDRVGML
jgi:signal peptidase I